MIDFEKSLFPTRAGDTKATTQPKGGLSNKAKDCESDIAMFNFVSKLKHHTAGTNSDKYLKRNGDKIFHSACAADLTNQLIITSFNFELRRLVLPDI